MRRRWWAALRRRFRLAWEELRAPREEPPAPRHSRGLRQQAIRERWDDRDDKVTRRLRPYRRGAGGAMGWARPVQNDETREIESDER